MKKAKFNYAKLGIKRERTKAISENREDNKAVDCSEDRIKKIIERLRDRNLVLERKYSELFWSVNNIKKSKIMMVKPKCHKCGGSVVCEKCGTELVIERKRMCGK